MALWNLRRDENWTFCLGLTVRHESAIAEDTNNEAEEISLSGKRSMGVVCALVILVGYRNITINKTGKE